MLLNALWSDIGIKSPKHCVCGLQLSYIPCAPLPARSHNPQIRKKVLAKMLEIGQSKLFFLWQLLGSVRVPLTQKPRKFQGPVNQVSIHSVVIIHCYKNRYILIILLNLN